ncbi:MAG: endolytic transglycosylase MltG [Bradymonadales bacterium]|nr:MAG: endolytic transglycosylase MltG [Bradymonadales bacterium]
MSFKSISVGILAFLGLSFFLYLWWAPESSEPQRFVAFSVEPNESFRSVTQRLFRERLIESESFFYYLARLTGKSGDLKAGEYDLNNQMSAWEVLRVITGSEVRLYRVTIREGSNMFQIARQLQRLGLVDEIQFLEAAWDPDFVAELNIPSYTVEGYLFPETYFIPRGTSARRIIRMLVEMFWDKLPDELFRQALEGPLSLHEVVSMASMIEKETGFSGEMPRISSVFYNRIARGMRLQSDPTAVYDLLPYGGRVTREHLFRNTPFNTYRIPRLPLTPVANPGLLAIRASLFPETTDYLFFVSRRDGTHHFSKTYEEHRKAIDIFLRGRRQ